MARYQIIIEVLTCGKGDEEFEETGYAGNKREFIANAENDEEARNWAKQMMQGMKDTEDAPPEGIYYRYQIVSIKRMEV